MNEHDTRPSSAVPARGLVSSRASGSRVGASTHPVPPALQDVVERFWIGRWSLDAGAPHLTEMVSDPSVHLVCEISTTYGREHPLARRVVGVWTDLWVRELVGEGRVVGMKLHPGAVRAFLPEEARAYTNRLTAFPTLPDLTDLADEAAVEGLRDWAMAHRRVDDGMAEAIACCVQLREGTVDRVETFASQRGCSVRSLQRLFRRHVGATPKQLLRRFRLQRVAAEADGSPSVDGADLAYRLGYADQAHLARDVRSATGKTLTDVVRARRG